jgi:hypothetical protein
VRTASQLLRILRNTALAAAGLAWAGAAGAAVPEAEAQRLDAELTPLGAERAGNAEGTIPPWTGGLAQPPPGFAAGSWHADPFAADEPRFTIDAGNLEQHAAQLSAGQQALLRAYPETWRMRVYPTRRSAAYPEAVYEASRANARGAQLVTEGKGGVVGSRLGSPFPIPSQGIEVVWNHLLRWRGARVSRVVGSAAVTRLGRFREVLAVQDIGVPYGALRDSSFARRYPNVLFALKSKILSPALLAGDGALAIEPIDQTRDPRKVWSYTRALRRVVRVPHFAYDFPAPNSESLHTVDDLDLFTGAPDRFAWQLLGKRELYIPYNAYRLHGPEVSAAALLRVGHIDPERARYELHRVWVVEGRLRQGARHLYARRIFYVDEDSWQIALAESYDAEGTLWRVNESHALVYYEVPVLWHTLVVHHDLRQRRYTVDGLDAGANAPRFTESSDARDFSPNALLYYIR